MRRSRSPNGAKVIVFPERASCGPEEASIDLTEGTVNLDIDSIPTPGNGGKFDSRLGIYAKSGYVSKSYQGDHQVRCLTPHDIVSPNELDFQCDRLIREIEILREKGHRYFSQNPLWNEWSRRSK